ncbi:MAG: 30S ribosomal protein S16 [bacterium]|nr:30S ribosomal protein S16 [bacterium]
MALKLKLQRKGAPHRAFYRLVAQDESRASSGKVVAILGQYSQFTKPQLTGLKQEEIMSWYKKGAKPTNTVKKILLQAGIKL